MFHCALKQVPPVAAGSRGTREPAFTCAPIAVAAQTFRLNMHSGVVEGALELVVCDSVCITVVV